MTRTFLFFLLYIACLASTTWAQSALESNDRHDSVTPTITARVEGSRTVVFESPRDRSNENDIPDSMARAFRDYEGTVHLVASSSEMFQNLGRTLDDVRHGCDPAFHSSGDANPRRLQRSDMALFLLHL
jgi:hypothetical protein